MRLAITTLSRLLIMSVIVTLGQSGLRADDKGGVDGTWVLKEIQRAGRARKTDPALDVEIWEIKDKSLKLTSGVKDHLKTEEFALEYDISKSPKWITVTYLGGANKGEKCHAIFEASENQLVICFSGVMSPDKPEDRPRSLPAEPKELAGGQVLVRFQRREKKEK